MVSFDGARRESGLGAAAWILWLRDEYGTFEKVFYGGRVLRNASAMIAEREALRMGIEHLTVLFPTEVSSFDFQVDCTDRTVRYKLNAQSLRLFGLHRDVNDAHRAGANRLQKQTKNSSNADICKKAEFYNTSGIPAEFCGLTAQTRYLGRRENSKGTKIWVSFQDMLCSRVEFGKKRF